MEALYDASATTVELAHIFHDGSSRNCQEPTRYGHVEARETTTDLKQYVEV